MAGKFIVLEGPDGCGKSTMLEAVQRHLEVKKTPAVFVRDPGATKIGDQIRKILLDRKNAGMCVMTELLLYLASRAQLINEIIRPALECGENVISDRFYISTLVYQGVAGAIADETLHNLVTTCTEGMEPDHIILFDVPAEVGLSRVGSEPDRMEEKGLIFHEEVRQRYLGYADGTPENRLSIVDASQTLLEVKKEVLEIVDDILC